MIINITLPREQQEWLEAQIKAGAYDSVEHALASIVSQHMDRDVDDMAWAKPLVDEGRASVERGDTLTLAEHLARIDQTMDRLKRR